MSENVVFLDTETTGLDPSRHVVWEVGLIVGDEELSWNLLLDPDEIVAADPSALRVNGYYDRGDEGNLEQGYVWSPNGSDVGLGDRHEFARFLVEKIGTAHLVGAVPSFDEQFLGDFLREQGYPPAWRSNDLSRAIDVDPDDFDRHTALGDARWSKKIYETVTAFGRKLIIG